MLMMRVTPKITDSPAPTRNRLDAAARPLSAWNRTASRLMGTPSWPDLFRLVPAIHDLLLDSKKTWMAVTSTAMTGSYRSIHCRGRTQLPDLLVARLDARAVDIFEIRHGAFAALERDLPDIGAHGRLVVDGAKLERADRALDLQSAKGRDQFVGVGCPRLGDTGGQRFHGVV